MFQAAFETVKKFVEASKGLTKGDKSAKKSILLQLILIYLSYVMSLEEFIYLPYKT